MFYQPFHKDKIHKLSLLISDRKHIDLEVDWVCTLILDYYYEWNQMVINSIEVLKYVEVIFIPFIIRPLEYIK